MLRHAFLVTGLLIAASCLVAAAEPNGPSESQWAPANPTRTTTYRPSEMEPAILPVAQPGTPNLADRLKAVRETEPAGTSGGPSSRRATSSADESAASGTANNAGRSVLVRRGAPATPETAPIAPPAAPITAPVADPAPESADEATATTIQPAVDPTPSIDPIADDSARRTARRPRRETEAFRSPVAVPSTTTGPTATANATASPQLALSSQGPMLTVEAEGPRAISMGKAANYRVRLVNQGSAAADRVIVTVAIPTSVKVVSAQARSGAVNEAGEDGTNAQIMWEMENVAARSQHELALSLQPTENKPIELIVDWVFKAPSIQANIEVQQPQLAMAVEGPTEMRFGETAAFRIRVSNPGNGPAENVSLSVSATGAAAQPNSIGTLAAGESRALDIELTANQAGDMSIAATAQGDGNLQAEASHAVAVRRAELAVNVTAPELVYAGTTATYDIRVANTGDAVAEAVVLEVQLPAGAQNVLGIDQKPLTTESPKWKLGDLPPGTDRVYTIQCDLANGGQAALSAQIQAKDKTSAADKVVTNVEAIADLKLIVNDPQGPLPVGKEVVYEIVITNRGTREASNIDLVAQFSDGVEPSAATGHRSEIVPGQVVFEPIRSLPAGEQLTVKITAKATKAGNLRFRAELTCGELETKLVSEGSTRFFGNAAEGGAQSAQRPAGSPAPKR